MEGSRDPDEELTEWPAHAALGSVCVYPYGKPATRKANDAADRSRYRTFLMGATTTAPHSAQAPATAYRTA